MAILEDLAGSGVDKVTFVGGEPSLVSYLPRALRRAKELGLTTCVVTNASRFTVPYFDEIQRDLDWLGVSIDSMSEGVEVEYGRGDGRHIDHAIWTLQEAKARGIKTKLNTVVGRLNWQEDLRPLWQATTPDRWKAFRLLMIQGQNDGAQHLAITNEEWSHWKRLHADLPVIVEDNDDMTESYVMIDPDGQVFQNSDGTYKQGGRVIDVGFAKALETAGWDSAKFRNRGGEYEWR